MTEKTERYQLAARNVVEWCREQASEHHGYVPIATSVDHDLARAYERIADLVEAGAVGRASSTVDIKRRLNEMDRERLELLLELRDRTSAVTTAGSTT